MLVRKHPEIGGVAIWHIGGESPGMWVPIKEKLKDNR